MFFLLLHTFQRALMITAFVFMMMVIVEYINVALQGRLRAMMCRRSFFGSIFASFLGATPGCLGAFTNVTLYEHGILSFGALIGGMIATSGDEGFVMLSLFPGKFLILTTLLFAIGVATGIFFDRLFPGGFLKGDIPQCSDLVVHQPMNLEVASNPFGRLVENLSGRNLVRWAILIVLLTYAVLVVAGVVGEEYMLWMRVALIVVVAVCVWVTLFGTDHFLKEHVWKHIVSKHIPRVFLWTFGVLVVFSILSQYVDIPQFVQGNKYLMLLAACLIGIIPESGPHFIFVMLFVDGALPFSILLASSIVQDGHGMLPLLAFSRRSFLVVKLVNFLIGLVIGGIALLMGF